MRYFGSITAPRGRDGGTGRRSGLKIRRRQLHGGSTPPPGTISCAISSLVSDAYGVRLCCSFWALRLASAARYEFRYSAHPLSFQNLAFVRGRFSYGRFSLSTLRR